MNRRKFLELLTGFLAVLPFVRLDKTEAGEAGWVDVDGDSIRPQATDYVWLDGEIMSYEKWALFRRTEAKWGIAPVERTAPLYFYHIGFSGIAATQVRRRIKEIRARQ